MITHKAGPIEKLKRTVAEIRSRKLGFTTVLAAGALFLPPLGTLALWHWGGVIGPWLRERGVQGAVIYAAAFALLAGMALLPTYAQSILGGYAFGIALGLPAALLGFMGGALIGYAVATRASGEKVKKVIDEKPKMRAVRNALVGTGTGHGFWKTLGMVTLVRLPPNSPFALTNLVMAAVRVPLVPFAFGTVLGMLPRTALAVVIGHGLKDMSKEAAEQAVPRYVWFIGIGVTLVVMLIIGIIADRAIKRVGADPVPGADRA